MEYRRCGQSGLRLPAISLGLWHNFGDTTLIENSRQLLQRAFDLGITHFDLANNYGPPRDRPNVISAVFCRRISCPGATS
jgi:L-glyceraldehyde 3-phosphate reductase